MDGTVAEDLSLRGLGHIYGVTVTTLSLGEGLGNLSPDLFSGFGLEVGEHFQGLQQIGQRRRIIEEGFSDGKVQGFGSFFPSDKRGLLKKTGRPFGDEDHGGS